MPDPWLTIIGVGEDGPEGLTAASLGALAQAEIVIGPARHLALLPGGEAERIVWPVPFADGLAQIAALRGRRVAALVSGDPFWFGAGAVLARQMAPGEWRALPGQSCFSLAANRLGWAVQDTLCVGLHAAPFARLRPYLAPGARLIATLRDGEAVPALAAWLTAQGFGGSALTVLESLGGAGEQITRLRADAPVTGRFTHPVCAAVEIAGAGRVLPLTPGRADDWFDSDGQITKAPVRALTLAALAPRPGEHLWDIGGGSGSVALEWLLAHPSLTATSIESRPDRAERITANAARLGLDRLDVVTGAAPQALDGLAAPDAVFIGGGLDRAMLDWLTGRLRAGTRMVANAVTLETEMLLVDAQARLGGDLLRVDLARSAPLGTKTGWSPARPIVQWSVTL